MFLINASKKKIVIHYVAYLFVLVFKKVGCRFIVGFNVGCIDLCPVTALWVELTALIKGKLIRIANQKLMDGNLAWHLFKVY